MSLVRPTSEGSEQRAAHGVEKENQQQQCHNRKNGVDNRLTAEAVTLTVDCMLSLPDC